MMRGGRGRGGTAPVAFLPRNVVDLLVRLGYKRSKSGNLYKLYGDGKEELLAIPNCKVSGDRKLVKWFVKATESGRLVDWMEGVKLSMQFNVDVERIHSLIKCID